MQGVHVIQKKPKTLHFISFHYDYIKYWAPGTEPEFIHQCMYCNQIRYLINDINQIYMKTSDVLVLKTV